MNRLIEQDRINPACQIVIMSRHSGRSVHSQASQSPTVTLFRDFAEDHRISMDIYANELATALRQAVAGALTIREFIPEVSRFPWNRNAVGIQELRWSRYVTYPLLARNRQSSVNHVIEHGYGHLLWTLNPERTIVTVHDLIPLARWAGKIEGVERGRFPLLNKLSVNALRHARCLIAISQSTASDLVDLCGCSPESIRVIPYGISDRFAPKAAEERRGTRASFGLPGSDTNLVLISGHAFYKNHEACLSVLKELLPSLARPVKLVRLGRRDIDWDAALLRSGVADHVIEIDQLSHDRVQDLYNSVDCLLFPSLYEGFGWPVVEAMACGIPVVCSDAGSLTEVAGDGAVLVKAMHVPAMAAAVKQVLENRDLRASLIDRGYRQAAKFRWDVHAAAVMRIYQEILGA